MKYRFSLKTISFFIYVIFLIMRANQAGTSGELSSEETFQRANQAYQAEDYQQASQLYEQIRQQNLFSAELFYNLGNAYFRQGKTGLARLNYEQAFLLSPRDSDILYNLNLLRQLSKDPPVEGLSRLETIFNLNEISSLFILICLLSIFGGIFLFFRHSFRLIITEISLILLLILCSGWLGGRIYYSQRFPSAIVINGPLDVRNGPDIDYGVGFTVPAGKSLLILAEQNQWYEIGLPEQGLKGWVPVRALGRVYPFNPSPSGHPTY